MRVRRCAVLLLEPREDTSFDLEALLAGGRLELDSGSGEGTRIHIVLPRVAPMELAAE